MLRMRIPIFDPTPTPTRIAVGVARPSAQGHDITRTPTMWLIAVDKSFTKIQYIKVKTAKTRTVGTKYSVTLSTTL